MRRALILSLLLLPGAVAAQQPAPPPTGPTPVSSSSTGGRPGAPADMGRLAAALSGERREAFHNGMQLTSAQDSLFWPIFDRFEATRRVISERMVRSVQTYAQAYPNVNEAQSAEFTRATTASERELIELRGKAAEEIAGKLGGKIGLRFYLIDDYLTIRLRMDVLNSLPVLATMEH